MTIEERRSDAIIVGRRLICSTAFLEYAFRTDSYRIEVVFNADGGWSYVSDTMLLVRGRAEPFRHRDRNTLVKLAEPTQNPLMWIRASRPDQATG
jgi:hypothetical protein